MVDQLTGLRKSSDGSGKRGRPRLIGGEVLDRPVDVVDVCRRRVVVDGGRHQRKHRWGAQR